MNLLIETKIKVQKKIKEVFNGHHTIKIGYISDKTNIFKVNFLNSNILLIVSFPIEDKEFYCETVIFENDEKSPFTYNYDVFTREEDLIHEIKRMDNKIKIKNTNM